MRSAANEPPSGSRAVRHTPFTAIESPPLSSAASCVRTRSRAPPSARSIASTVPLPATSPVNISALTTR